MSLAFSRSAVMAFALAALPLTAHAQRLAPGVAEHEAEASRPAVRLAQAGPVAPDERFWSTIRNSSLPDLFEMFIKRYPDSARRPEAEARLAALKGGDKSASAEEQAGSMLKKESNPISTGSTPPPTRSAGERPQPLTDARAPASFPTRSEIMVIQAELLRVGCLGDSVDGIWGPKTQAAASQFASSAGLEGQQVARPGMAILDALRKTPGRVCAQTASVQPIAQAQPAHRAPTVTRARPAPQRTVTQPSKPKEENWAKSYLDSLATNDKGGGGDGGGGGGGGGGW